MAPPTETAGVGRSQCRAGSSDCGEPTLGSNANTTAAFLRDSGKGGAGWRGAGGLLFLGGWPDPIHRRHSQFARTAARPSEKSGQLRRVLARVSRGRVGICGVLLHRHLQTAAELAKTFFAPTGSTRLTRGHSRGITLVPLNEASNQRPREATTGEVSDVTIGFGFAAGPFFLVPSLGNQVAARSASPHATFDRESRSFAASCGRPAAFGIPSF